MPYFSSFETFTRYEAPETVKELEIIGSDDFRLTLNIPLYGIGWAKVQLPRVCK